MDEKTYKDYKRRIANAEAKVDNKPPKFDISTFYKTRHLIIYMNRVRQLDKENMKLLRQMNEITRLGGKVDCWLPKIEYQSRLEVPEIRNRKIMKENRHFLGRLNSVCSKYPTTEFIQSWKEMKRKASQVKRQIILL